MGKTIVLTGAGGVLCGKLAEALAQEGHKIAVLDLRMEAASASLPHKTPPAPVNTIVLPIFNILCEFKVNLEETYLLRISSLHLALFHN